MPVNHTKLNQTDVVAILRRRGYAFHSQHRIGLRLTKADLSPQGRFKETQRRRRVLLAPISEQMLDDILMYARNAGEAAEQIEKISLGLQSSPEFAHMQPVASNGLNADMVDKLIQSRVRNELAQQTKQQDDKIAQLQAELEKAKEELAKTKEAAPKRRGRPPGSKNKKTIAREAKKAGKLPEDLEESLSATMAAEAAGLSQVED